METQVKKTVAERISDWLHPEQAVSVGALAQFRSMGFPERKNEEYKYSMPGKNLESISSLAKGETLSAEVLENCKKRALHFVPNAHLICIINGQVQVTEELSQLLNTKEVHTKANTLSAQTNDSFALLNSASFKDILYIRIKDKVVIDKPIVLLNLVSESNVLVNPRTLIECGKHAEAHFVEISMNVNGASGFFNNSLTEVIVGENAHVTYYKLQDAGINDVQLSTLIASQHSHSTFDTHTVTLSGQWIRNNLSIFLDGTYCTTHLNGLYIGRGKTHIDNHTLVDHRMPYCNSNQLYKGIVFDKSEAVFNGKIYVQVDAQKTNAYQSSKNILMSDDASVYAKPQLEILADDVKCSHGSSTGKIDKQALFYLKARGIGEDTARNLLLQAFIQDALNTISIEDYRKTLEEKIETELHS